MKEGYEYKKLKEVALYSIGLTYKPSDVNDDGTIVLRSSNIQHDKLDLNDIVKVNCPIKESLYVQEGDILMCSRNGSAKLVGKVALIPKIEERMTYGTFMMLIRSVYNPYLFYFFKSETFRSQIKHGEANMINQITRYMLDDVYLHIPPLSEQQSIVEYLDSAFAKIDAMKANAEKALYEAKALFQASLKEMLEPKEGWEEKTLGEVCIKSKNIRWEEYQDGKIFTYIDLTSVNRETLSIVEPQFIEKNNAPSRAKQIVKTGDIIFATTRPTLRRVCLISEDFDSQICSTGFCVLRPKQEITSKWIFFSLLNEDFYQYIEPLQTGASYPAVTDGIVKNYRISYPSSITYQQTIVDTLDSLKSKVDKLQENYDKISQECDALKQALLRKVFE